MLFAILQLNGIDTTAFWKSVIYFEALLKTTHPANRFTFQFAPRFCFVHFVLIMAWNDTEFTKDNNSAFKQYPAAVLKPPCESFTPPKLRTQAPNQFFLTPSPLTKISPRKALKESESTLTTANNLILMASEIVLSTFQNDVLVHPAFVTHTHACSLIWHLTGVINFTVPRAIIFFDALQSV